ncbi:MAG: acyl-CoA dehydrogenase [Burkholderiaceae bacterium]
MLLEKTSPPDICRALRDALASSASLDAAGCELRCGLLAQLARDGLADLPRPASGRTLERWRMLGCVAGHDLALAKLYEGHADALAILAEAGVAADGAPGLTWGMWAAESPGARVVSTDEAQGRCRLDGVKAWCSGARHLDRALLTVWRPDGTGPFLAEVDLRQDGVSFIDANWRAVGMAHTGSLDVRFEGAGARLVGPAGFYLARSGFWHGGAGVAACWHGGACAIARVLRDQAGATAEPGWHRLTALGAIDRTLAASAALLREAAAWIDAHPRADAQLLALRTRAVADAAAEITIGQATRALGATPLCRDAFFARMVADLPVFVRQSHGDRDLAALGRRILGAAQPDWMP